MVELVPSRAASFFCHAALPLVFRDINRVESRLDKIDDCVQSIQSIKFILFWCRHHLILWTSYSCPASTIQPLTSSIVKPMPSHLPAGPNLTSLTKSSQKIKDGPEIDQIRNTISVHFISQSHQTAVVLITALVVVPPPATKYRAR